MKFRMFRTIGSLLTVNILIGVSGLMLILFAAGYSVLKIDDIDEKRHHFIDQRQDLSAFRQSILESVVLLDRLLLLGDKEIIPKLLAVNEDIFTYFSRFQSNAQTYDLLYDFELARENEPVIFNLRNLFFVTVGYYRKNQIEQAMTLRRRSLDNNLGIVTSFIEKTEALRKYDIQNQEKILHDVKEQLFYLMVGIVLTVAAFSLAVNLLIRLSITRRLSALGDSTLSFAKGEFDVRAEIGLQDEIGTLAVAFNYMAEQLQDKDKRLTEENKIRIDAEHNARTANLAKSEFLSTMSHEIRTPLNGVVGMAQLLRNTKLDAEQQTRVDTILSSGEALLSIINDVLDMSKIESGNVEIENVPYDFSDLIALLSETYGNLTSEIGLDFDVQMEIDGITILKGDPVRLRQVLLNLLSNAFKFTYNGGIKLLISKLEDEGSGGINDVRPVLCIVVEDTGKGIVADRLPTVFKAFTQEDTTITREYGGSGLGLSIVENLTELMGGKVSVESTIGVGTRFTVLLPLQRATDAEVKTLKQSKRSLINQGQMKPLRVLVAEDNAANAMISKAFLEKQNHTVTLAMNGRFAVEAVEKGLPFDLIFMDIHMPEMNGIEATRLIRSNPKEGDIPIIGLTADAFAEQHQEFRKAGMNDVLTKPFTEEQLTHVILRNVTMGDVPDRSHQEKKDQGKVIDLPGGEELDGDLATFSEKQKSIIDAGKIA